jgi:NTE family protein
LAPKIAVVLGSGGIKPLSSIALLDFLAEQQFKVDLFVGCSGGSLVAATAAMGYDTQQIYDFYLEYFKRKPFSALDYKTLLSLANLPMGRFDIESGIAKPDKLLEFYDYLYGDQLIENLKIPTVIQTTDIQTGEAVVLDSGSLKHAIYATSALYPFVPPIFHQGRWLVDGALTSPLPLMEAVKRNMDVIIVVRFHETNDPNPATFLDGFYNVISSFNRSLSQSQMALALDFHHYEIIFLDVKFDTKISVTDFEKMPIILEAGRVAVDKIKAEIEYAINNYENSGNSS